MAFSLGNLFARIKGGWKTVGVSGRAAFASDGTSVIDVGPHNAFKLSAYLASTRLIADTMGVLDFQLKDKKNNIVLDHDIYALLAKPNQYQTQDQFISAITANGTTYGNGLGHIRRDVNGNAYSIDFYSTDLWNISQDEQGRPVFQLDGTIVPYADVFHVPGFSVNGYWGLPAIFAGADILRTQIASNRAAQNTFSSGLKVGGFFTLPAGQRYPEDDQLDRFEARMSEYNQPQNVGKWLTLLPGISPVANQQFKIDPVSAELLQSRYFGIEEICRLIGVPPPLIGHTDKASSWASSLDSLNQFLVDYTLLPRAKRMENVIRAKLLSPRDQKRFVPKFDMDSLLRGDLTTRWKAYQIARQTNVYSPNDVLRKEGQPAREGGDDYTVQTTVNQTSGETGNGDQTKAA